MPGKDKTYRLAPLAQVDLEDIWLYTLQKWSREQADTYHRELVAVFEGLAAGRKQGRAVDIRPHYLKYPTGAHMVYFQDHGDWLAIIRILHQKQDVSQNL
ncbi:type II toxin-antitoxin system RelE/ParE family toxin [Pusillimonas sp. ANT_WB101]|uniref:type II toxin-antitoxin system RelE/ParE family toxin n=1 Tax=Pusillimonas sp. ANT_WB101 TaxID=2597356 RepID=UPI0011EDFC16|nr:type II toxin-antitoxin system RelE/ParE family toxin [Pusillimonas sp. ANT_WB101]KAA0890995.1 type II toxin-antitoxin system RelE/ParE family toxin [Pusillimonas sp. ANT_WB101]